MISEYTLMVKDICETYAEYTDETGYNDIENVLEKSWERIFDFDFPIYNEEKRKDLCKKILRHYYLREIGMETVGAWKFALNRTLNEEMPYFNQLYESAELEFSPFDDTNISIAGNRNSNHQMNGTDSVSGTNTSTNTGSTTQTTNMTHSGTQRNLFQDTPQGSLNTLDNETYLTDARKIIDDNNDAGTIETALDTTNQLDIQNETTKDQTDENKENYTETRKGKSGGLSYSELLMKYREAMLNIDKMIIESLDTCFMQIF